MRTPTVALAALALVACQKPPATPPPQPMLSAGQAQALVTLLAAAPSQGFQPNAFPTDAIARDLKSPDAQTRASAQGRLIAEAQAYARAEHGLSIPRRRMDPSWGMRPAAYDAAADLRQALAANSLPAWTASLAPADPRYQALTKAYGQYLAIAGAGGWSPVGGPRDPALRQRLAAEDPAASDGSLAQAIARAQMRYGLKPTGALDAATLAALNVPAQARAAQIRANLERWRWAPRETPATRIEVNSVGGVFDLYQDGQVAMHMLVAAGRPGDETPILASRVHAVVLNPPWNVPDSIADKELLPKEQANPGYLAEHGFVVSNPASGQRLVQQPGPKNSLGQVKFVFDNSYGVYMHDTPAKAAFSQAQRQVSHGCVRLERALDLARLLLSEDATGWPPERVDETLSGSDTTTIRLQQSIPVEIFYWTAWTNPDGSVSFRDDVYGWDAAVLRQLDAASSSLA
jgi:murein L,D-transpeptidase YcbB/YkuD